MTASKKKASRKKGSAKKAKAPARKSVAPTLKPWFGFPAGADERFTIKGYGMQGLLRAVVEGEPHNSARALAIVARVPEVNIEWLAWTAVRSGMGGSTFSSFNVRTEPEKARAGLLSVWVLLIHRYPRAICELYRTGGGHVAAAVLTSIAPRYSIPSLLQVLSSERARDDHGRRLEAAETLGHVVAELRTSDEVVGEPADEKVTGVEGLSSASQLLRILGERRAWGSERDPSKAVQQAVGRVWRTLKEMIELEEFDREHCREEAAAE